MLKSLFFTLCVGVFYPSFSLAREQGESNYKTQLNRGIDLFEKGRLQESFNVLNNLYEQNPNNPVLILNLGHLYLEMNKPKRALELYRKLERSSYSLKRAGQVFVVSALNDLGEREKALDQINMLNRLNLPDGLYEIMLDELDRLIKYESDYFNDGVRAFDKKEYKKALKNFHYAWIINPNDNNSYMKGYTYVKLQKIDAAKREFDKIQVDSFYQEAMELIDDYNREKNKKKIPISFYVDHSRGNNNNPNTVADSSSTAKESDMEINSSLGVSYKFLEDKKFELDAAVDWYSTAYKTDSTSKSTGLSLSLPFAFNFKKRNNLVFTPKFEKTTYGGEDYLSNRSLVIDYTVYNRRTKGLLSYTHTIHKELTDEYFYLAGRTQEINYTYTRYVDVHEFSIAVNIGTIRLQNSDTSMDSLDTAGAAISGVYAIFDSLMLESSLDFTTSTYLPDADDFVQKDRAYTLTGTLSWAATNLITLYVKDEYVINKSNLNTSDDDNNYKHNTLSLGFSLYY